nr:hypothetical protein CcurKRNrm1_p101 [Cryptomonas curvata]
MKNLTYTLYKLTDCLIRFKKKNRKLKKNSKFTSFKEIYQLKLSKEIKKRKLKFKILIKNILDVLYITFKKDIYGIVPLYQTILVEFFSMKLLKPFNFFYFKKKKNSNFCFKILLKIIKKTLDGIFMLLIDNICEKSVPYFLNQIAYLLLQVFYDYPEQENQIFRLFLKKTEDIIKYSYSRYSSIFKIIFNKSKCMRFFLISEIVIFLKNQAPNFFLIKKSDKMIKILINLTKNSEIIIKVLQLVKTFKLITYSEYFLNKKKKKNEFNKVIINIKTLVDLKIQEYPRYKFFKFTIVNKENISKFTIYINLILIFIFEFVNFKLNSNYYLSVFLETDPLYLICFSDSFIVEFLTFLILKLKCL